MKRRFNLHQKLAMLFYQGEKCAHCGNILSKGWHADHKFPFSKGGETTCSNGQALCPRCNIQKSNKIMKPFRSWQTEAFANLTEKQRDGGRDFLTVAGVASGKTYFASRVASSLIETGVVNRVIVVTPTINLVDNWENEASGCGLNLRRAFGNSIFKDGLPKDAHGYVTTYATLVSAPYLHEICATQKRTHVIFDEPHHMCTNAAYGNAALTAFKHVEFRHFLTGTPLRSDFKQIPFVEYLPLEDGGHELKPDYIYSFGEAVADGVCRRIAFIPFGEQGEIKFTIGDKEHNLSFDDTVNQDLQRYRLRSATQINKENRLMAKMIREGDRLLGVERRIHQNAGGLIIANDQFAARDLEKMVLELTGKTPVIVISDDEDSHRKLNLFKESGAQWLISVRMVSEGVDIPRLRVLVYLSRITEELSFIQSMGRIARMQQEYPGISHFLMPRDERFVSIAKKVEAEMEAFRISKIEEGNGGGKPGEKINVLFTSADGLESDTIISGEEYKPGILSTVIEAKQQFSSIKDISELDLADLFSFVKGHSIPKEDMPRESWDKNRGDLTKEINDKVSDYCFQNNRNGEQKIVHSELNIEVGIFTQKSATITQLNTKLRLIKNRLANI